MSANISSDETKVLKQTFKAFVNLLKEFPKNAADDFIYDETTIKKIGNAGDALTEMKTLFKKKKSSFGKEEKNLIKDSFRILSELMNELPSTSEDEFLYDRLIHQLVEEARENVIKLGQLFP